MKHIASLGRSYSGGYRKFWASSYCCIDENLNLYVADGYCYYDEDNGNRLYRVGDIILYYDEDNYDRLYRVGDVILYYDEDNYDRLYRVGDMIVQYDDDGRVCAIDGNYF